jgi:diaminopimelate decarboxylase
LPYPWICCILIVFGWFQAKDPALTASSRRNGLLHWEGVSLADAAARWGTPLFAYSRASIEGAFDSYSRAFDAVPHRVCYALKANASGGLLRILAAKGAGADIVSGGELLAALRAGFPPDRIVFAGVGKTDAEIALALHHRIGEFNAESEAEIGRIAAAASAAGATARVALRVNPDIDPGSHPYISTGLRQNKFGVDIALAADILRRARDLPGVAIVGVQCHIGSQVTDLDALAEAARELAALSRTLLAEGFRLETIDIGGGLGVDYEGGQAPEPLHLAARVLPELEGLPLTLFVEPGRSIVASSGVLVTRVLDVKENGPKRFVIVDAAMNDLLRPALYQAHHRIEPVGAATGRARWMADVVGPVCETGDFLARNRELAAVSPGDLLAIHDVGAYGFSMSSNYNLRPRAAEIMVDRDTARLIRRRETFEDMVRSEVDEPLPT